MIRISPGRWPRSCAVSAERTTASEGREPHGGDRLGDGLTVGADRDGHRTFTDFLREKRIVVVFGKQAFGQCAGKALPIETQRNRCLASGLFDFSGGEVENCQ